MNKDIQCYPCPLFLGKLISLYAQVLKDRIRLYPDKKAMPAFTQTQNDLNSSSITQILTFYTSLTPKMHPQPGIDQLSEHLDNMNLERDTHQVSQGTGINPNLAKESGDLDQKPSSYHNHPDVFNNKVSPSVIGQGQGHQGQQGQQGYNTPNPIVGPSQTLGVGSQTLEAGRGILPTPMPTPIAPPAGKSPSRLFPHTSLPNQGLKLTTPTRSGSGYFGAHFSSSLSARTGYSQSSSELSFYV